MTRLLCGLLLLLLAGCASQAPLQMQRSPDEVRAEILRKLPTSVEDRQGWANDVYVALTAQDIEPGSDNVCAVLAVTQQESTYTADPEVPGLAKIARAEIERRAAAAHVPGFVLSAALRLESPDGRSYAQRLERVRTERELSELYEDFIGMVPLGSRLFAGHNPVRTGGPMQVRIDFAEQHARGYPYTIEREIRHEVFTRRGGLYFGTRHLLGYPANYGTPLYRFADFNAGWYASRNAAFQNAVSKASGIELAPDGDLLMPGANLDNPGATERAVRALGGRIGMDAEQIRRALQKGRDLDFEETDLYARVFALADAAAGMPVPRAVLPGIVLESPKITRTLTTA
ncbi:DUF1615 domain-containing protein [Luteimonas sp. Sa2BVA3]|uniref:DUF1615 domain-containing protein n=1 Tax=Luteimonas colneyensis TaxID=2762230 RepID=A0ABR8UIK7_9GAMM|nr:DUF1615 domain-containing protein [Luteimonas colneyensis]MBD7987484.1 DUF1615 domain-containing protein [Luteimonas colneyensis]